MLLKTMLLAKSVVVPLLWYFKIGEYVQWEGDKTVNLLLNLLQLAKQVD